MGSGKKIAEGVIWTVIQNVVSGIYGFISVPILLSYFGKTNYGLIGLAMSVNVYLRLMDLGFNSTNVRYFSNWLAKKEYSNVCKLFQTSMSFYGTVGLINSAILLIISFYSNKIFNLTPEQDIIVKHLFYILAISAFISWFTSCFEQIIASNEYVGWIRKMALLPKFIQFLILILTVTCGLNIEWYYGLTAFSMFVLIPIMIHKIRSIAPFISFRPSFNSKIFKEVLPYCVNIFSFSIFQFSIIHLRPVFLGIESTPDAITEYNVLDGIIKVVLMLGGAFVSVILPSASKVVAQKNMEAQNRIAYGGTKYISITLSLCCFGMMCLAPEMLTAYVGKEYLHLLLWLDLWLMATLGAHNQAISSLILAGSDIRAITYSSIFAALVGLLSCWLLIPRYNVGGTVIAYCIYCLIQLVFYYAYYWPKVMKINSKKVLLHSFLPFAFIGFMICYILRNLSFGYGLWFNLISKGLVFFIMYTSLVYIILDKEDKSFLRSLINKK